MTFAEIAEREGIEWCPDHGDGTRSHIRGYAEPSIGRVHYADRKVTRIGLRRFLMLVASIIHSHNRGQPEWLKVWEQNRFAQERAMKEYRTRIPKRYSETDRARVRLMMDRAGVLNDPRWRHIAAWSMNRGGHK